MEIAEIAVDRSVPPLQLSFADREAVGDMCRQAHSALQWIARLTHSFVEPSDDGSHLLLRYSDDPQAIVTPEIAPGMTVGLYPGDFYLQFRKDGTATRHSVVLDDISPTGVEAWCLIELLHRNLDRDRFSKDLPYDTGGLMKGDAEEFETIGREALFERLGALLAEVADLLRSAPSGTGEILVDPSDFAIFRSASGEGQIGLCLGDRSAGQPYYYRTRQPVRVDGAVRSERPQTEILTAEKIAAKSMSVDGIRAFLSGED